MENIKICPQCNNSLDIGEFYIRPDGTAQSWCKKCQKNIAWGRNKQKTQINYKKWCDSNWTHLNQKSKLYRKNGHQKECYLRSFRWLKAHPERVSVYSARRRTRIIDAGFLSVNDWIDVLNRFDNICLRCNKTNIRLTIDHIIPVSKGGTSDMDNLQPLCKSCNSFKNDKIIDYRGLE